MTASNRRIDWGSVEDRGIELAKKFPGYCAGRVRPADSSEGHFTMGGDPEFFFKTAKRGAKRGAERIIPSNGIKVFSGAIVLDGFQAEFNVQPSYCRQILANNYQSLFKTLASKTRGKDLVPDFSSIVTVSKTELRSLSSKSRQFGCAPSFNLSMTEEDAKIKVNPAEYRTRTAGGHIHLGATSSIRSSVVKNKREDVVRVLDIVLGNISVLLDREPGMAERRTVYGRAGEYRKPKYGLEYRVLSNFWLKSYALMSLVYSLARYSAGVVMNGQHYALFHTSNYDRVVEAINNNDFDLALRNFEDFCVFLFASERRDETDLGIYRTIYPSEAVPIPYDFAKNFLSFVDAGIDYLFPVDIIEHWRDHNEYSLGWEEFACRAISDGEKKKIGSTKWTPLTYDYNDDYCEDDEDEDGW